MEKMNEKKKRTLIISIISLVLLLLIGVTIAFFGWTGDESDVSITVSTGTGSCTKKSDNNVLLEPVSNRNNGRILKMTANQQMNDKAYITWNMIVSSIPEELQDATFKYELVNTTTGVVYESSGTGNFSDVTNDTTITFSNSSEKLDRNVDYEFTLYLWIDGTIGNNPIDMAGQTINFDMTCSITGTNSDTISGGNTLIEHIRSEYASNVSETPADTGNGSYYYADSVKLMNDGLDITGTEVTDTASLLAGTSGNIRYYGDAGDVINNYIYFNCDTYPETNCEKWRIIGIVDGKVKIMRGEQIGTYSWDYTSTGESDNNWKDATLMTMLNNGYYYSEDNVSYYNNSTIPITINFSTGTVKGISEATRTKELIDTEATWYINGITSKEVYPNEMYKIERTGTNTWPGGIALAYPSDYGYSVDLRICQSTLFNYRQSPCSTNWMKNIITNNEANLGHLISPTIYTKAIHHVNPLGHINDDYAYATYGIVPVLYLKSDVEITSDGDGSSNNPYRISF